MPVEDAYARPLRNLRVSVTDRCNLRCAYCMPEEDYVWLPREQILHFEEIATLVDVFLDLGVDKVRLTGGSRSSDATCRASSACWPRSRAYATSRSRRTASCSRNALPPCAPRGCVASR